MSKKYTREELEELGRAVIASREKQRAVGRERRRMKKVLYALWQAKSTVRICDITDPGE